MRKISLIVAFWLLAGLVAGAMIGQRRRATMQDYALGPISLAHEIRR